MKKLVIYLNLIILIFVLINALHVNASYAFNPKYTVHTSNKDIESKNKQSLEWYADNIDNKKFYWYDANKHINWLKNKALRWYDNGITKGKFYFVHSDKELDFTKKKALRWYAKNSE